MLYLAEVKKQVRSFLGTKTELKLLACQRNDQSWSAVPGEEFKEAEEANQFENGALVMVNLGGNRQVQGKIEPAAPKLIGILQNFSRILEKAKSQEENIEQWKQSLTYQSQELSRREMEIEGQLEQLENLQEELQQLEQQRQEIQTLKQEAEEIKQEFERKQSELEGAWEHLRGEQRRLEEKHGTVIHEDIAQKIRQFLEQVKGAIAPTETLREQAQQALELINQAQACLDECWQQREQKANQVEQQQQEVDQQRQRLDHHQQEIQELQDSLTKAKQDLRDQQRNLEVKQQTLHILRGQQQDQEEWYSRLSRLGVTSGDPKLSQEVDIEALENMPLGELETLIQKLQADLERVVGFVNDQEEELTMARQDIDEIQSQLATASEYDRIGLEQALADSKESYGMLDETLVGQRRNLREREEVYNQHCRILRRRQGLIEQGRNEQPIDLAPVLQDLAAQKQRTEEELQKLEHEVEQMQHSIEQAQGMVAHYEKEQVSQRRELNELEKSWQQQQESLVRLQSQVEFYEEALQPIQAEVDELRSRLEELGSLVGRFHANQEEQESAITQLQNTVNEGVA